MVLQLQVENSQLEQTVCLIIIIIIIVYNSFICLITWYYLFHTGSHNSIMFSDLMTYSTMWQIQRFSVEWAGINFSKRMQKEKFISYTLLQNRYLFLLVRIPHYLLVPVKWCFHSPRPQANAINRALHCLSRNAYKGIRQKCAPCDSGLSFLKNV